MGAACGREAPAVDAAVDGSDDESAASYEARPVARRAPAGAPASPAAAARGSGSTAPGTPLRGAGESARRGDAAPRGAEAAAPSGLSTQLDSGRAAPPGQSAPLRWQRGELLGTGAFGRVFLGLNEDTGELLAVKEVALSGSTMEKAAEQLRGLEAEVALLRGLSHPNIVRYLGTERTPQALHIFLEFVPGGSIASLLSKFGPFAERVISVYTRQILEGLEYLHRNQIMHRDIKGANILVDNAGCVKLADFGASRQLADLVTMESGFKSMKGTPYWMAPEVIKQTGHGRQADIWSVGCTAVEMATAKPPWSEYVTQVSALFHIASAKGPPPLPESLSPEATDFLLLCFNRVPKDRPNATRLLQHPFVASAPDAATRAAATAAPLPSPAMTPHIRRTVSTIPEGPSPSPSTGPQGASGAPRFTPADALSSLGSEAASTPGDSDEQALDSLRRRLQLDASGASDGAAAASPMDSAGGEQPAEGGRSPDLPPVGPSPALSGLSMDNPMEEPSWTPEQGLLSPAAHAALSPPVPSMQLPPLSPTPPPLPPAATTPLYAPATPPAASASPAVAKPLIRVTPRRPTGNSPVARAVAALEQKAAVREESPPAAKLRPGATSATPLQASLRYAASPGVASASPPDVPPLGEAAAAATVLPGVEPLSRLSDSRLSDETIDSLLARAEQQSVAAREEARRELRRSKQAQWEAELQRELDAQRAEKRKRQEEARALADASLRD